MVQKLYYLEWEFCAALPLSFCIALQRRQASAGVSVFEIEKKINEKGICRGQESSI